MSQQRPDSSAWLRPRGQRRRQRTRRHLRLGPGFASGRSLAPASAGAPPSLGMPEPAPTRSAFVSGSISLLAHLLIVAFLALSAWLAPDVVEEIIPVQIIRDAPEPTPPPPPRRVVVPRRAVARARVATAVPRPTPVARPAVQPVAARAVQQANIQATAAPTELAQRQVTSQRVVAQRTLASPTSTSVARVPVATVAATDLSAPTVDVTGPRAVTPGAIVDTSAPQVFQNYEAADVNYAAATVTASSVDVPVGTSDFAIDADLAEGASSYGTPGGTGGEAPAGACIELESVKRYYGDVKERMLAEWSNHELPDDIPADAQVVLLFELDESGSASTVSVSSAPNEELGESCKQALLAAAPFPSMSEDVRCLAGRRLRARFSVPVAGAL